MTCWMCCSTDTAVFEVKGRKFWSCEACIMAHIDLPKLAASLEAAKGRKCIDPSCETHNPKKLLEDFNRTHDARCNDPICKMCKTHGAFDKRKYIRGPMGPDFTAQLEVHKLCACGHAKSFHWKVVTECAYASCGCKEFTEPELCGQRYPAYDAKAECQRKANHIGGHRDESGIEWFSSSFCTCGHELGRHSLRGQACRRGPCLCEGFKGLFDAEEI